MLPVTSAAWAGLPLGVQPGFDFIALKQPVVFFGVKVECLPVSFLQWQRIDVVLINGKVDDHHRVGTTRINLVLHDYSPSSGGQISFIALTNSSIPSLPLTVIQSPW